MQRLMQCFFRDEAGPVLMDFFVQLPPYPALGLGAKQAVVREHNLSKEMNAAMMRKNGYFVRMQREFEPVHFLLNQRGGS